MVIGFATIYLFNNIILPDYTKHNQGVTVPDITKLEINDAIKSLRNIGLRDSIIDRRYNAAYPANYVIDQTPGASTIVKPNRKVYLTVNTSNTPKVIVPEVKDLSLRNAELQLKNYGLKIGTISYESSPFKNTVIRQSVEHGKLVERGSVISLTISDGLGIEKVKVPKLIGLKLFEAQANLRNAGLRIGEIRFKPTANMEANLILDYEPSNSDSLVEGSKVNLNVSEQLRSTEVIESSAVIIDSTDSGQTPPDSTLIIDK